MEFELVRWVAAAVLAAGLSQPPSPQHFQEEWDWSAVWDAVESLAESSIEVEAVRAALPTDAPDPRRRALFEAALPDSDEESRARLARAIHAIPPGTDWPLSERESWLAARSLPAGPARGRAVLHGLDLTARGGTVLDGSRLRLAYEAGVEAAEDQRLGEAVLIQRPLHALAQAEWSAMNLALSLRRVGDYDGADAVLERQLERPNGSAELLSQRGLNALAAGRRNRARDWLVQALARGSSDAAVILGRVDLAAGRYEACRRALRPWVESESPGAWAVRGWALSLVETPLAGSGMNR